MSEFDKEQFFEWWESRAYDDDDREVKKAAWCAWKAARAQGEPVAWLKFRSVRVAADDVVEGFEVCSPEEVGDDGSPAFPVCTYPPSGANQGGVPEDFKQRIIDTLQYRWNDWCEDTGCIPDDFEIAGPRTTRVYFEAAGWAWLVARDIEALLTTSPNKPEQEWVRCSDHMPRLGQRVILEKNGVVQHYMPILDQADIDGFGNGGEHFWDFEDDADECPHVDYERDRWMALPPQEQRGAE